MGSLVDELRRREAAARAEAEQLRGRIAELAERLAGVEERLSRLGIAREVGDEVLDRVAAEGSPVPGQPQGTASPGAGPAPGAGGRAVPRGGGGAGGVRWGGGISGICWRWLRMPGGRCGRARSPRRRG